MLYEDKLDGVIDEEIYFNKRETYQNQIDDLTLEYTALMKTNVEIMKRIDGDARTLERPYRNLFALMR